MSKKKIKKKSKKKQKTRGSMFYFGSGKKPKKTRGRNYSENSSTTFFHIVLTMITLSAVIAGIGFGFKYLESYTTRYVSSNHAHDTYMKLVDKPEWVNHELENRIFKSVEVAYDNCGLSIDDETASKVYQILKNVEWFDSASLRVSTKYNGIEISSKYRKPVVYLDFGRGKQFYVDKDLYLLRYVSMPQLHIVEVKGFKKAKHKKPIAGEIWRGDDIDAAIKLVEVFQAMDAKRGHEKPLLSEISYIDVKDYGSRKVDKSQLTLVAKDGTRIRWGSPVGKASVYLEASESEKLKKIYGFYERYGTIQGKVKYIDPRIPEKNIPLP